MAREPRIGDVQGTESGGHGSILPLPADVVAQIKSSAAITSLTDVVVELVKNALDARATTIDASVDLARGACSVADNGLGIAPVEFGQGGGLGKLYYTSKYLDDQCLGRNGTFLASLAAVSLLTIVSRHQGHRSHSMVTFHHSKVAHRQSPAPPQHELQGTQGTRVTVRNLFGNLPVRVKQRAVLADHKLEHDRLWDTLSRQLTCLILSWCGQLSLKVRALDGRASYTFSSKSGGVDADTHRPSDLNHTLNTLTQAKYIAISDWPSWIPVSASTSSISIKGAISLQAAPCKRLQFLSLGNRPLSSELGSNELYDEVNRIFSESSFGVVEDDASNDNVEKTRRKGDRRLKSDGYTNRQIGARKGVDRYPMFHLHIRLENDTTPAKPNKHTLECQVNVQAVVAVLSAMIKQWLSVHHFRPCQTRYDHRGQETLPASTSGEDAGSVADLRTSFDEEQHIPHSQQILPHSLGPSSCKKKRHNPLKAAPPPKQTRHHAFAEWSRVKSGQAAFFSRPKSPTGQVSGPARPSTDGALCSSLEEHSPPSEHRDKFNVPREPSGPLNKYSAVQDPQVEPLSTQEPMQVEPIVWTDPSTKKIFYLNARTGYLLAGSRSRPRGQTSVAARENALYKYSKPMRLPTRPATTENASTDWLNAILESWDNPVFKPMQKEIHQARYRSHQFATNAARRGRAKLSAVEDEQVFSGAARITTGKLSRDSLKSIQVIAQLDRKYIFAKMRQTTSQSSFSDEVLVLIDQHAADERVQVESLLAGLCASLTPSHPLFGYRSKLGHASHVPLTLLDKPIQFAISPPDQAKFIDLAPRFATWGILYNLDMPICTATKEQPVLSVTALPPVISERCKAEPRILISFLRSALWKYADTTATLPPSHLDDGTVSWVRRLAFCPEGLVDLVNSRACRAAIMFNDELSLEECRDMVGRLAECVFPFMCAHGRPSMVPLVGTGDGWGVELGSWDEGDERRGGFVDKWKEWRGICSG